MFEHNDNELLYLIGEGDENALNILANKYEPLIRKRIGDFNIRGLDRDDFYQEGLMALIKAIKKYDSHFNKTFNKYFDLLLQRQFINVLRSMNPYHQHVFLVGTHVDIDDLLDNTDVCASEKLDNSYNVSEFNDFEKKVLSYMAKNYKAREIAKELNIDIKKIYNTIYSIKKKLS